MQVSLNNLAPPNPGIGFGGGSDSKAPPGNSSDFKAMVQSQQSRGNGNGKSQEVERDFARMKGDQSKTQKRNDSTQVTRNQRQETENSSSEVSAEQGSAPSNKSVANKSAAKEETGNSDSESSQPVRPKMPKEVKAKTPSIKGQAVLKFMDSLESELGIPAERFSAALAQLPTEVRALPIEESAPFVIEQMGIPELQQEEVTAAYVGLLQKSGLAEQPVGETSLPKEFVPTENFFPANPVAIKSEVLEGDPTVALKPTPRQKLNATIDELNRRFFDVKPKVAELAPDVMMAQNGVVQNAPRQSILDPSLSESLGNEGFNKLHLQPVPSEVQAIPGNTIPQPNIGNEFSPRQAFETRSLVSPQGPKEELLSLNDLEAMRFEALNPQEVVYTEVPLEGIGAPKEALSTMKSWSVEELPFLTQSLSADRPLTLNQLNLSKDTESFKGSDSDLGGFAKEDTAESVEAVDNLTNAFSVADGDRFGKAMTNQVSEINGKASVPIASPQERIENLQKISRATETLAEKGGGEMKVLLTPEGLGTIQLKVKMQEGKLQVEMKAENRDSQKLLESSLGELKQNLSAHRLSIDSVKVDVGGDFTRQESSSSFTQSQPQFDMGREQARQFMNLFRDGNLSQRQAMFDAPGFKTYRTQKEEPLAPISNEVRPRASLSGNKGKELNLVA